jgi:hypothetical protein
MYKNGIENLIVINDEVIGLLSERQILQYLVTEKIIHDKPSEKQMSVVFLK